MKIKNYLIPSILLVVVGFFLSQILAVENPLNFEEIECRDCGIYFLIVSDFPLESLYANNVIATTQDGGVTWKVCVPKTGEVMQVIFKATTLDGFVYTIITNCTCEEVEVLSVSVKAPGIGNIG
ncbi:MAG: hypothetical protein ACE5HW_00570 [Candidatus Methanofastidiosia archaeon]